MYKISIIGYNIWLRGSEESMADRERPKIIKPPTKQIHLECDVALYKDFEEYCHRNGKDVSKAIRAYMKMCVRE